MSQSKVEIYHPEEDINEADDEEVIDLSEEAENSSNIPLSGSPVYPHIYVGQSGIPDMVEYNETDYRGDNYLLWHDIFPDIAANSIYG